MKRFVLSFRHQKCIHYSKLRPPPSYAVTYNLCSFRAHQCAPTQRASSSLTAVHEASAGLTALVWLHFDSHTHSDGVRTGSLKSETEHSGYTGQGRQNKTWIFDHRPRPSCLSHLVSSIVVIRPRFPTLVVKSSTLYTVAIFN